MEILFVGILYWQLDLTEKEAEREKHYKQIVQKTTRLEYLVYQSLQAATKFALTHDQKFYDLYIERSTTASDTLKWLKKELAPHKDCAEAYEGIHEGFYKGLQVITEAVDMVKDTASIQDSIDIFNAKKQSFQTDWNHMLMSLSQLTSKEDKIVSQSSTEQQRMRRLIRTILILALVANVVVAFILSKYFTKAIVARLGVMVDNMNRFKTGQELNPLLGGGKNEITMLDGSFHDMADTVLEAQRMRQTFVAMISHDLRTPLTNVMAYLELVSEGVLGEVPPLVIKETDKTARNVSRLIRLINDLLTLEKMEAGKMQMTCKVIYLETVIEQSIAAIEEFAKTAGVELEFDETNAEVFADQDRLVQVVINLASNAVKFSPKGGVVKIKTIETDEIVELQVIDQGRGVPAAYRDAIFEKYKQVKTEDGTKKGGTGLGLPICKMIIEQLGGSIGVSSEDGKGSTFWFKLPKDISEAQKESAI